MRAAKIDVHSNVAILADLAGYGKTMTFLSLVVALNGKDIHWLPHTQIFMRDGYGTVMTKRREREKINTTLVVVPDNLVEHWQRHLDDYTNLNYEIVDSDNYTKILIDDYDLVLCPARHYNPFIRLNNEYCWNRIAFDEADSINIPNTEYASARFLWLITATYDNIPKRKNKGFLKAIFKPQDYWIDPIRTYFFPVVVRGTDSFVKSSFNLLEPEISFVECLTPSFIRAIHRYVTPHVLELVNAGDIDGAIVALGGCVDTNRNIMELVTRSVKNDITVVEAKIEVLERLKLTDEEREKRRLCLNLRLESLGVRRESLEKAISEVAQNDCTICCDRLCHPTVVPCCNNIFCGECLLTWLKDHAICPLCRGRINNNDLYTIVASETASKISSTSTTNQSSPKKDKLQAIIDIIKDRQDGGRFIIFSGHEETFTNLKRRLDHHNIRSGLLTTIDISKTTLRRFRQGEISVILLNAEYNGAGIEIPEATDVILYHQLRPSLETQAIARAQRPGRHGRLRVWRLKHEHEYITPPELDV
jgi:hypothetical protein